MNSSAAALPRSAAPVPEPPGRATTAVVAACVGIFAAYAPITVVSISLATIGRDLGASTADLQWVLDAFVVAMAAVILPAGTLGDLAGRKKVYLGGLGLLGVGSLIGLLAGSLPVLWAGQALAGLGAGALLPTTLAILSAAVVDPRRRAALIGVWASCLVGGLAFAPLLAGVLLAHVGWRWIFVPELPLVALAVGFTALRLPDSHARTGRRLDLPGQVAVVVGVAALVVAVIEGPRQGWSSPLVAGGFVLAGTSFAAFVAVERASRSPVLRLELFRSPAFGVTSLVALLAMFALIGANFLLSLFFGVVQHHTPARIAWRFLVLNGVVMVMGPLVGRLHHRAGPRLLLSLGLGIAGAALLAMLGIDAASGLGALSWRLAALGVGFGLVLTPMTAAAVHAVPHHLAGMASAANNAFRQTGGALGPAVLGALLSARLTAELPAALRGAAVPSSLDDRVLGAVTAHGIGVAGAASGPHTPACAPRSTPPSSPACTPLSRSPASGCSPPPPSPRHCCASLPRPRTAAGRRPTPRPPVGRRTARDADVRAPGRPGYDSSLRTGESASKPKREPAAARRLSSVHSRVSGVSRVAARSWAST